MKHIRKVIIVSILLYIPFDYALAQKQDCTDSHLTIKELFLPENNSSPREETITHVLIHSISNVKHNPDHPYSAVDIYFLLAEHGLSSHYLIDRDGGIFQLVPENRVAYHAGRSSLPDLPFFKHTMNEYSIGIELMGIGAKEEMVPMISEETYESLDPSFIGFTEQQYQALTSLLNQLYACHPTIQKSRNHIIGHDDYAPRRKVDPGRLFDWSKIGY